MRKVEAELGIIGGAKNVYKVCECQWRLDSQCYPLKCVINCYSLRS